MKKRSDKLTVSALLKKKANGEKIVMITAYDYPSAALLDAAGVDMILIGDSLANVVQGKENTLSVKLEETIYHSEMVARAAKRAFVVVDMPFPYCQFGPEECLRAAARIMKETGADGIKLEGGIARKETIQALVDAGIPVVGHCGLMPQSVKVRGYKIERNSDHLTQDVLAVQEAGAFAVVLECVPRTLAGEVTQKLQIPTIGIGAGNLCDGQVLVFHDFLLYDSRSEEELPKHARAYAHLGRIITEAAKNYISDVQSGAFPSEKESF